MELNWIRIIFMRIRNPGWVYNGTGTVGTGPDLRMMVQMRPRVSLAFPSTISWAPMFSRCTRCSYRKLTTGIEEHSHQKSSRNVRKFIFDHTEVKKTGSGTYDT